MTVALAIGILSLPVACIWALSALSEGIALLCVWTQSSRVLTAPADPLRSSDRQRILILVPAHDEALLIESCVRSLLRVHSSRSKSSVVVIADNCADTTAALARFEGASVLERFDSVHVGKPHAIAWAFTQLQLTAYDAVLIIDADTVVDANVADALAQVGDLRDMAVQAYFGLSNEQESWLSLLAGLLARVRYEGQYNLKARAGLNCPLTGNGMCLGTGLLARAGWAPDALTENWELYARYTAMGERILYAPAALLHSQEAGTLRQSATQRRRWQSGRVDALRAYWRPLLSSRTCSVRQKLDALSELATPGPVVYAGVGATLAAILWAMPSTVPHVSGTIFGASVIPLVFWTLAAWIRGPDRVRLAGAIVRLPVYLVWRVGLALLTLVDREKRWKRSPRHVSASEADTSRRDSPGLPRAG